MSDVFDMNTTHTVCIICEGDEDVAYIRRLNELKVWSECYKFVPINAKSATKIFACYQNAFQSDKYEAVLVFCDTDRAPHREYALIKDKINSFHDNAEAAKHVIIYANPCTMQIILLHFGDADLKTQGKKANASIIQKLTGVSNYDAHQEQIEEICRKIYKRTYPHMKERVEKINYGDETPGSTNFGDFLLLFESEETAWIRELDDRL